MITSHVSNWILKSLMLTDCATLRSCGCVVDAVEQRDGKRPLKELEERSLKPYKRR